MTAALKKQTIRIPDYTLREEIFNSLTHLYGAVFGGIALLLMAFKVHDVKTLLCVLAYGLSIILLYSTSCWYHSVPASSPKKGVLRIADHCMVFVLVLGTCVPVFLLGIGGLPGRILLSFVTVSSAVGIVLTVWDLSLIHI